MGDGDDMSFVIEVNTNKVIFISEGDISTFPGDVDVLSNETDTIEIVFDFSSRTSRAETINPNGSASSSGGEFDSLTIDDGSRFDGSDLSRDCFDDELHHFSRGTKTHWKTEEFIPMSFIIAEAEHAADFLRNENLIEGDLAVTSTSSFTTNIINEVTRSLKLRHLRLIVGDFSQVVIDEMSPSDGSKTLLTIRVEFENVEAGVLTNIVDGVRRINITTDIITNQTSSMFLEVGTILDSIIIEASLLFSSDGVLQVGEGVMEGHLPEFIETFSMVFRHQFTNTVDVENHVGDIVRVKTDCIILFSSWRRARVSLADEGVLGARLDVVVEIQPAIVFKSSEFSITSFLEI